MRFSMGAKIKYSNYRYNNTVKLNLQTFKSPLLSKNVCQQFIISTSWNAVDAARRINVKMYM